MKTKDAVLSRVLVNLSHTAILAVLVLSASPARDVIAALPIPTSCQSDLDGANDQPGQKDITEFCVEPGLGTPFEIHSAANLDITGLSGSTRATSARCSTPTTTAG